MRTFLGVLMVLIVSGADVTIKGVLEDNILLPCNCSDRNLSTDVIWQTEGSNKELVFKYNRTTSILGRYNGRTQIFLSQNRDNCSVLLTNITVEDQRKYRCRFFSGDRYNYLFVYLNVSAIYDVCQKANNMSGSVKVFQCDVKGRYGEAEIQWKLDEHARHSTEITQNVSLDAATGLYHFHSTLTTNLNWTSEPICEVKAKDVSIISSCGGLHAKYKTAELNQGVSDSIEPVHPMRYHYFKIIPIMSVLGLSWLLVS